MRRSKGRLAVIYANDALADLDDIANYNEGTYGRQHAKSYMTFLEAHIEALGKDYAGGKIIGSNPDLRYIRVRRSSKKFGHVVVYTVGDHAITVVHIFHSAQDWENKLTKEPGLET